MKIRLKNSPHASARGFTLVELSIVLVIIGLIIGGVLTGQQVIQNARVTKAVTDVQGYESQFQTYQQNYGAMPGDDANADSRFTGGVKGNGNGSIDGTFDFACAAAGAGVTTESCQVWNDLRLAGLVKNQSPAYSQPSNPFSGLYGFQNGAFSGGQSPFTTTVVCLNNVPGSAAQAIDTRLDDGVPGTGNIQAMVSTGTVGETTAGTPAASYAAAATYSMCIKM